MRTAFLLVVSLGCCLGAQAEALTWSPFRTRACVWGGLSAASVLYGVVNGNAAALAHVDVTNYYAEYEAETDLQAAEEAYRAYSDAVDEHNRHKLLAVYSYWTAGVLALGIASELTVEFLLDRRRKEEPAWLLKPTPAGLHLSYRF